LVPSQEKEENKDNKWWLQEEDKHAVQPLLLFDEPLLLFDADETAWFLCFQTRFINQPK